jgi:hypothetical protein
VIVVVPTLPSVSVVAPVMALLVAYCTLNPVWLLAGTVHVIVMVSVFAFLGVTAVALTFVGAAGTGGVAAVAILLYAEMPAPFSARTR